MMPRMDSKQMVYLSLALGTMNTIYGYTAWAMPHIIRFITH
jgi:hypothetical protein